MLATPAPALDAPADLHAMMVAGIDLLLWQGGEHVVAGLMTAGQLVAFLELYLRFVNRGLPGAAAHQLGAGRRRGLPALRPLLAPALPVDGRAAVGVVPAGLRRPGSCG